MDMSDMDMSGMDMSTTYSMSMNDMDISSSTSMVMTGMGTTSLATMTMSGMNMATGTSSGMMHMSTSTSTSTSKTKSCTMSMLWNWYSKDVCFISRQWRTSTKALFGGTCVGCFALLITINWWRRILLQYKIYCAELREKEVGGIIKNGVQIKKINDSFQNSIHNNNNNMFSDFITPLIEASKHKWFWALNKNLAIEKGDKIYIYPSIFEHLLYCVGDTMEWSVHHVIMLLFMYFNGYVFISCMIGAGTGFLLWQYKNINVPKRGDNVSKRCCL